MKIIGVVKEYNSKVVALTPANVKSLSNIAKVIVESGAGLESGFTNEDYVKAGALLAYNRRELIRNSEIILTYNSDIDVQCHDDLKVVLGCHQVYDSYFLLLNFQKRPVRLYSLTLLPKNTLSKYMRVTEGIERLSGYQAVISGVNKLNKVVSMMQGNNDYIPPSKIMVIGAGVAGQQAIETAKNIGAVVFVFDNCDRAMDVVEKLGGIFITKENLSGNKNNSSEILASYLTEIDLVICTLGYEGFSNPSLLSKKMISTMKNNAKIIDLTSRYGATTELTIEGAVSSCEGVDIIGSSELFNDVPLTSSMILGNKMESFLRYYMDNEINQKQNEILLSALVVDNGQLVNEKILDEIESL